MTDTDGYVWGAGSCSPLNLETATMQQQVDMWASEAHRAGAQRDQALAELLRYRDAIGRIRDLEPDIVVDHTGSQSSVIDAEDLADILDTIEDLP